jgi:hypothetical protein
MAKKSLHIALAFILYLSTAGISVHSHYCKNELKDISFWLKAESCHSVEKTCPHHPPQEDENERDCCDNQVTFEKVDTDLINMIVDQGPAVDFVPAYLPHSLNIEFINSNDLLAYKRYRPPPRQIPLHIQYQTFLC